MSIPEAAYQDGAFAALTRWGTGLGALTGVLVALVGAGLAAAHHMDVNGHHVTGMNNHVVWGLPHVFAVFLIVVASGALNVASLASVMDRSHLRPLARVSVMLSVCLLAGGLAVLVLDLGRPDRLVVAMTSYNFRSVFTWNVFLYSGFIGLGLVYLWTLMDPAVKHWSRRIGIVTLTWRFVLTSGTGLIFGFLVARDSYDAALMAPMFVMLSLSAGLAVFVVTMVLFAHLAGQRFPDALLGSLSRLMAKLALLTLYFVVVLHVGNAYVVEQAGFSAFILAHGGGYRTLYWIGFVLFGTLVPATIIWTPLSEGRVLLLAAHVLVVAGALALMYVTIIAGQAYPVDLMPGYEVIFSTFLDGAVAPYAPSAPEWLLGIGGGAFGLLLFVIAARVLPLFPATVDRARGVR